MKLIYKNCFFDYLLLSCCSYIYSSYKKKYFQATCLAFLSLFVNANAQTFEWVRAMGGTGVDNAWGVTTDGRGNVFVAGSTFAPYFIPGDSTYMLSHIGSKNTTNAFLVKYDGSNNFQWVKCLGRESNVNSGTGAERVATDSSGNVYMTGILQANNQDTIDFNPGGSGGKLIINLIGGGGYVGFLVKYDANGNFLWVKSVGRSNAGNSPIEDIAVDGNGNVYVTGAFDLSMIDFNPGGSGGMLTNNVGGPTIFIVKYDGSGNFLWAKGVEGNIYDIGKGIAIDGSNGVYITGEFEGLVNFNPGGIGGVVSSMGRRDIFLAKFDTIGNYLWAKAWGGSGNEGASGIAVADSDNVYIVGAFFSDSIDLNPGGRGGTLKKPVPGSMNTLVAKYDGNGDFLWAKDIDFTLCHGGISVDASKNVYIAAYTLGEVINFGGGTFSSRKTVDISGNEQVGVDMFLVKYNKNGDFLWVKGSGGITHEYGKDVAIDGSGNAYVTGEFNSYYIPRTLTIMPNSADFNPGGSGGLLTALKSASDVFLVKYACSDTTSSYLSVSTCESYTLNGSVYSASGTYTQVFPNTFGCDSTVTLALEIIPMDKPVINVNDSATLGVAGTYVSYQWLFNGIPIAGATDSVFTILENGEYRVVVIGEYGCSDTSEIYLVNNLSINEGNNAKDYIRIYPNPVSNRLNIVSAIPVTIELVSVDGRVLMKKESSSLIDISSLSSAVYFLRIYNEEGVLLKTEKVVKAQKD